MKFKLDYEKILEEFNHNLIYKLRKHGLNKKSLSLWVPNDNFLESFKSLYFSLKENGINDFEIDVKKDTVKSIDIKAIKKVFNEIKIVENKNKFKISINKISEFKGKKDIIDQVKKREISKIDYIYGSLGTNKKQEKIKEYFKKIYQSNFNEFKKQKILEQKEFRSKKIVFNNQIYEIKYKKDKSFISIDSNTEDKSLVGAMILFNKLFFGKNILDVINNSSNQFMKYILKSTKTKIEGIVLPFNLGKEVFIVHNIWLIFSDYYKQKVNKGIKKNNSYWILLEKRKREIHCKKIIKLFLKENNIKNDSIIFNYIEKDLSGNPMRIFININENIPSLEKPNLIRKLESFLKKNLDTGLQVYYQEKKDLNKIRRL